MANNFRVSGGLTVLNIDGTKKLYQNALGALQVSPTAPIPLTLPAGEPAPVSGDLFLNLSTNEIYEFNGTSWFVTGISKRVSELLSGLRWTAKVKLVLPASTTLANITGATNYSSFNALYSSAVNLGAAPYGLGTFATGDRIIVKGSGDYAGLYQYSGTVWNKLTSTNDFAQNDMFFVDWDPTDVDDLSRGVTAYQVVTASPVSIQLIADFDFETAASVNIASGFTPVAAGSAVLPGALENVQTGLEKLSGIVRNLKDTIFGSAAGFTSVNLENSATDFGNSVSSNVTIAEAIKQLFRRGQYTYSSSGTNNTFGMVAPDTGLVCAIFDIFVSQGSNRYSSTVKAVTDGTNTDITEYGILRVGTPIAGLNIDVTVSSDQLQLLVAATASIDVRVSRRFV